MAREVPVRKLEELLPLVQGIISEVRRMHTTIWPSILSDLGLISALGNLFRQFEANYPQLKVKKEITIQESAIAEPLKIVIYRIVQEALNNIAKHSGADTVLFSLKRTEQGIEATVRDNGTGLAPEARRKALHGGAGVGLSSMRERAHLSGGAFRITSSAEGTTVSTVWPTEADGLALE